MPVQVEYRKESGHGKDSIRVLSAKSIEQRTMKRSNAKCKAEADLGFTIQQSEGQEPKTRKDRVSATWTKPRTLRVYL